MSRRKGKVCPTPDKLAFSSRETAEFTMQSPQWARMPKRPTRVYLCSCGSFHMTSKKHWIEAA